MKTASQPCAELRCTSETTAALRTQKIKRHERQNHVDFFGCDTVIAIWIFIKFDDKNILHRFDAPSP
jgi:hypothetical protein